MNELTQYAASILRGDEPEVEFRNDSGCQICNTIPCACRPGDRKDPLNQNPHVCPVCNGRGSVRRGFYSVFSRSGPRVIDNNPRLGEDCRTCRATGVLWG